MSVLSVVIPSYNEEENIETTAGTIGNILKEANIDYELVFVSDGSKDRTFEIIEALSEKDARIKGIQFSRNFGKEAAIFAGLSEAKGDCVSVIDCDLQHPPKTLVEMYRLWEEGYEVVEGIKSSRGKESFFHKMFVGIFYGIMSSLMKIDMNATSDFKLLDRKAVDALLTLNESNTFFRALSFWVGFRSVQVEYDVAERTKGTSKWSFGSLVRYAITNTTYHGSASDYRCSWIHHGDLLHRTWRGNIGRIFHGCGSGRIHDGHPVAFDDRRRHYDQPRYYRPLSRKDLRRGERQTQVYYPKQNRNL